METFRSESDQELVVTQSVCTCPLFFFKKDRFANYLFEILVSQKKSCLRIHVFFLLQANRKLCSGCVFALVLTTVVDWSRKIMMLLR